MDLNALNDVTVTLVMSDLQTEALAQLIKRIGWAEIRQNAVDDLEAYEMRDAVYRLQKALAEAGYAPR